nr:MAG TPA: hypothetical protein [Caudoviricetes sp.]
MQKKQRKNFPLLPQYFFFIFITRGGASTAWRDNPATPP